MRSVAIAPATAERLAVSLALACAIVTLGCGDDDPTGIEWSVSGHPVTAHFGDPCLATAGAVDGPAAEAAPWSVGVTLSVGWVWQRPCGGWLGEACSPLDEEVVVLAASDVWRAVDPPPALGPNVHAVESIAPGTGSIAARANGHDFDPLELHAVDAAALVVRAGWGDGTGVPADTTSVTLAPGAHDFVVVALRDVEGVALCGSAPVDVTVADPIVTVSAMGSGAGDLAITPRTSFPLVVTAGASPGSTTITFRAGGRETILDLHVVAP